MNYMQALRHVYETGVNEHNNRTKKTIKRAFGLSITYRYGYIFSSRKVDPGISAAEAAWMLSGENNTKWLKKHCSIWNKFEDSPDYIETAYGYRWKHQFGRDQIQEAIQLLHKDPSSRQALVMAWHPGRDGLMKQGFTKNVPCPFAFNVFVVDGSVRLVVYQRSADMVAGMPYDLMTHWYIGTALAIELDKPFWGVQILVADAHIYQDHWPVVYKMINRLVKLTGMPLTGQSLFAIETDPDDFVKSQKGIWNGHFAIDEKVEVAQ